VERDVVDAQLEVIARELPGLDLPTEALVSRIWKLSGFFRDELAATASAYGLSLSDWRLLATLRSEGEPYRLPSGRLAELLDVSPATVTSRVDRLESSGFVRRTTDPGDRRVQAVELTPEGKQRWEHAVGIQAAKEARVASALDERQNAELNDLLRRLLLSFGGDAKS
jgi:DNA-binding MarR family transcriptional regulator